MEKLKELPWVAMHVVVSDETPVGQDIFEVFYAYAASASVGVGDGWVKRPMMAGML